MRSKVTPLIDESINTDKLFDIMFHAHDAYEDVKHFLHEHNIPTDLFVFSYLRMSGVISESISRKEPTPKDEVWSDAGNEMLDMLRKIKVKVYELISAGGVI